MHTILVYATSIIQITYVVFDSLNNILSSLGMVMFHMVMNTEEIYATPKTWSVLLSMESTMAVPNCTSFLKILKEFYFPKEASII